MHFSWILYKTATILRIEGCTYQKIDRKLNFTMFWIFFKQWFSNKVQFFTIFNRISQFPAFSRTTPNYKVKTRYFYIYVCLSNVKFLPYLDYLFCFKPVKYKNYVFGTDATMVDFASEGEDHIWTVWHLKSPLNP